MEAPPLPTSNPDNWAQQFAESLDEQRDRVRDFLAAQHGRIERAEKELAEQLHRIAEELAQDRFETRRAREEIQQRSDRLARETETLESLKEELAARQSEWEQLRQRAAKQQDALAEQFQRQQEELERRHGELARRQAEIDRAETRLHQDRQTLELVRGEHQAQLEQLATKREQLAAEQAELDAQREKLAAAQSETEGQRRRIAREFKAQHAAHLKELDRRRAELERRDTAQQEELQRQLETAQRRQGELSAELETLRGGEAKLSGDLKSGRQRESQLTAELESLRDKCGELEKALAQESGAGKVDPRQLQESQAERDALLERLAETELRLTETERRLAEASRGGGDQAKKDLQRRYDMAMEDLRELKAKNAKLQEKLSRASSATATAAPASDGLDWEAQKQRILDSLESDFGEEDEEQQAERVKIEEVIQATDEVLADKDVEIAELKQLLENQSTSVGSMVVGAAALGEILDNDAIIQEERESLKRMQQEWEEKLRKAEVEISVERAKIARGRAELEEKIRILEKKGLMEEAEKGETDKSGKPVRGRWLAQLGLKDDNDEKK